MQICIAYVILDGQFMAANERTDPGDGAELVADPPEQAGVRGAK
jgi:hypothetical protein